MMGYRAPSKAAIRRAIQETDFTGEEIDHAGLNPVLNFRRNVQETSFFGLEQQIPGENTVVGPDAYSSRKWFATLTVNEHGIVTGIR